LTVFECYSSVCSVGVHYVVLLVIFPFYHLLIECTGLFMSLYKGEVCYSLAGIVSERNKMMLGSVTPVCICSIVISRKRFMYVSHSFHLKTATWFG